MGRNVRRLLRATSGPATRCGERQVRAANGAAGGGCAVAQTTGDGLITVMPTLRASTLRRDLTSGRALTITPPDDTWLSWRVASLAWLLPALADVTGMYFGTRMSGAPVPFWRTVVRVGPVWGVWVPLTGAIFWLADRAPIWRALDDDEPGMPHGIRACVLSWAGVATHIAASLVVALLHAVVIAAMVYASADARQSPAQLLVMTIEDWLPVSLLLYWMTLGAAIALARVREAREQERRAVALEGRLAQAELAVLRAQLEPHFLFNALNTAVSLVRAGEPTAGVDVLTRLADVLRHLLDRVAQETSLADELRLLDSYLGIARARFGARLAVSVDIPEELGDAVVPGLALQPLVENALRHGVGRREDGGHVWVDGWTPPRDAVDSPAVLYLRVRDDGPGFGESAATDDASGDDAAPAAGGVGLRNLRDRLERLYGPHAAGLSLRDRAGGGAEVTLWLPLRHAHRADVDAAHPARV
jgi:two-component system, LytTR family, sensor kinase